MAVIPQQRKSLLSSNARIQAPWVKVTIGNYTFGVFTKSTSPEKDNKGFYISHNVQYPNFIQSLNIVKINGQVNQYTLTINYPVRSQDDPNFFEKVFSSVANTRRIVFSYGDSSMPNYIYKDEEAIITQVSQRFGFGSGGNSDSVIAYTVKAVSSAALGRTGTFSFINYGKKKPSTEIKNVFKNTKYGLKSLFKGMSVAKLDSFIDGSDKEVELESKINIAPLDYISYLVSCMIPEDSTKDQLSKDIYILTIHDDTVYDKFNDLDNLDINGPYFRVERTSNAKNYSDAYEIDIGYSTNTIVTDFQIDQNENYSIYYDYNNKLWPEEYAKRINNNGEWEDVYAPSFTSKNGRHKTNAEDISWYTKLTKYPISGSITIKGLLRPATLMTYLRLNVIFPGGHKHISSGLYIVTKQVDDISVGSGYKTTLSITRIEGDNSFGTEIFA